MRSTDDEEALALQKPVPPDDALKLLPWSTDQSAKRADLSPYTMKSLAWSEATCSSCIEKSAVPLPSTSP